MEIGFTFFGLLIHIFSNHNAGVKLPALHYLEGDQNNTFDC